MQLELEVTQEQEVRHITVNAEWIDVDDRTRAAWANQIDATEFGAYAMVLAAIELALGQVAIHRAETLTGADYYIAPRGSEVQDLETAYRLEVSGVGSGIEAAIRQRLRRKLKQAAMGASNLPAIAGVVGFRHRLILLSYVEETV